MVALCSAQFRYGHVPMRLFAPVGGRGLTEPAAFLIAHRERLLEYELWLVVGQGLPPQVCVVRRVKVPLTSGEFKHSQRN